MIHFKKLLIVGVLFNPMHLSSAVVQTHGKKEITSETYDVWKRIINPVVSSDGKWVAYTLETANGVGELVVRSTVTNVEFRVPRGVLPSGESPEEAYSRSEIGRPTQITADSQFVLFSIASLQSKSKVDIRTELRLSHSPGQFALGIMKLPNGSISTIENVSEYKLPKVSGRYVAYVLAPVSGQDTGQVARTTVVLRDLVDSIDIKVHAVTEFTFDNTGRYFVYIVTSPDSTRSGVYVRDLASGSVAALSTGEGMYRSLAFDSVGRQLAFVSDGAIYYAQTPLGPAARVVSATALEGGLSIAPSAGVQFTAANNALIFSVSKIRVDVRRRSEDSQPAKFDLWHWGKQMPMRQSGETGLRSGSTRSSLLAVYHFATHRWYQVADEEISTVQLTNDARQAVAIREIGNNWGARTAEVSLISVMSGDLRELRRIHATTLMIKRQGRSYGARASLSPSDRYLLYFENRRWFSYDLITDKVVDLTGDLLPGIRFEVEGTTAAVPVAGVLGWTKDDRRVLLYDNHDIWVVDPSGKDPPRDLTRGIGRRHNIVFRYWLDHPSLWDTRQDQSIDETKPLLLTGHNMETQESSIWKVHVDAGPPEPLLTMDKRITLLAQSQRAPRYLLSVERFEEFPDLWIGSQWDRLVRISNANPQQREYLWGSAELVSFVSESGRRMKGILYVPDGFNPALQYPLVVSIYETAAHELHEYFPPVPAMEPRGASTHMIAPPNLVSQGYLVFQPDIASGMMTIGQSAVEAVRAGVQALIDRGFVDRARIGLIGHSFGGYETLYVLTQANLFRCAIEGAGISNLISSYGANSSMYNYYEYGQGRMAVPVWERVFAYLDNSPLLYAHRIETPLLIMHNDADRLVPFAQGMELFSALRRNKKEVYLFNYVGEGHRLENYTNRLDWDRRMREFFAHFLKDASLPDWMKSASGIAQQ